MIATYDMAGVIAVGIGFLVILLVVVPVALIDRHRERDDERRRT